MGLLCRGRSRIGLVRRGATSALSILRSVGPLPLFLPQGVALLDLLGGPAAKALVLVEAVRLAVFGALADVVGLLAPPLGRDRRRVLDVQLEGGHVRLHERDRLPEEGQHRRQHVRVRRLAPELEVEGHDAQRTERSERDAHVYPFGRHEPVQE